MSGGTVDGSTINALLRGGAALAVAALAVLGVTSVGASQGGVNRGGDVIRYKTVTAEASEVDHGDPGPSLGDQLAFSDSLRRAGRTIGHNGGVCTLTSLTRGEYLCVGQAKLNGRGTITGQFFLRPEGPSNKIRIAVTGGTGDYSSARGQGVAELLSETEARVTLRLR